MPLSEEDTYLNAEVEEIKKKVRKLAQDHSRTFHCGTGVTEALAEVGITETEQLKVEIEFAILGQEQTYTAEYDFDRSDLAGKNHNEQCAWVAQHMSPSLVFGESDLEIDIPLVVHDLNKVIPPPPRLPGGYMFRMTMGGRVAHIVYPGGDSLCSTDMYMARGVPLPESGTPVCKRCQQKAKQHSWAGDYDFEEV